MGIGAGINFTGAGVLQALSNLQATAVGEVINTVASLVGPYRPSEWAKPAQTTITVPGQAAVARSSASLGVSSLGADAAGVTTFVTGVGENQGQTGTPDIIYVFDAVFEVEHQQSLRPTAHPVQSSASISDHAFVQPSRITLDIGMSDAMQSYTIGQWSGSATKSVNAWQTLSTLMANRQPVTITTRLQSYTNMLLVDLQTRDNARTGHSLRARVTFQQIFTGSVTINAIASARPQDTQFSGIANSQVEPTPNVVANQYFVTPPPVTAPSVTGSGDWSSNPADEDGGFS